MDTPPDTPPRSAQSDTEDRPLPGIDGAHDVTETATNIDPANVPRPYRIETHILNFERPRQDDDRPEGSEEAVALPSGVFYRLYNARLVGRSWQLTLNDVFGAVCAFGRILRQRPDLNGQRLFFGLRSGDATEVVRVTLASTAHGGMVLMSAEGAWYMQGDVISIPAAPVTVNRLQLTLQILRRWAAQAGVTAPPAARPSNGEGSPSTPELRPLDASGNGGSRHHGEAAGSSALGGQQRGRVERARAIQRCMARFSAEGMGPWVRFLDNTCNEIVANLPPTRPVTIRPAPAMMAPLPATMAPPPATMAPLPAMMAPPPGQTVPASEQEQHATRIPKALQLNIYEESGSIRWRPTPRLPPKPLPAIFE